MRLLGSILLVAVWLVTLPFQVAVGLYLRLRRLTFPG